MAAGAIPPPLFFERRQWAVRPAMAFSGTGCKTISSVDHRIERPARFQPGAANGHRPKDI
jgi:hypothetical protein